MHGVGGGVNGFEIKVLCGSTLKMVAVVAGKVFRMMVIVGSVFQVVVIGTMVLEIVVMDYAVLKGMVISSRV